MGKFYLTSAILFLLGMAVLWRSAEMANPPRDGRSTPESRIWPPILLYTGGVLMLSGALAFVATFSTHTRMAAHVNGRDPMEL